MTKIKLEWSGKVGKDRMGCKWDAIISTPQIAFAKSALKKWSVASLMTIARTA